MYSITVRPIGTIDTKPRVYLVPNSLEALAFAFKFSKAVTEAYGEYKARNCESGPDVQIVYTKEHGDIIRLEFDVLPEEDTTDVVPNGT